MSKEHGKLILELKAEANRHLEFFIPLHNIKTPSTENAVVNKKNQKEKQPAPSLPQNNHSNASPSFAYSAQFQWQCSPYMYYAPFRPFLFIPPVLQPLQIHSKKMHCHCQIDLDTIVRREDTRTTLIIKNIPNKYISKMLLYEIEENHQGTYDFLYLPIDYKSNGNLGYAIINMLSHLHMLPFYKAFHGKIWDTRFGEHVISLEYAWIQGKDALVTHFQNSGCVCEFCWPILFH
ncbi:unnamed protein product [Lathyrus oleraceus]|uniref:protein MEI2-like 2 n=1 Tax=Pisum sativum TaxID=3888 RepID=UPI001FC40278|nr:protein MEI2-like 2 [Pisum sativum]